MPTLAYTHKPFSLIKRLQEFLYTSLQPPHSMPIPQRQYSIKLLVSRGTNTDDISLILISINLSRVDHLQVQNQGFHLVQQLHHEEYHECSQNHEPLQRYLMVPNYQLILKTMFASSMQSCMIEVFCRLNLFPIPTFYRQF